MACLAGVTPKRDACPTGFAPARRVAPGDGHRPFLRASVTTLGLGRFQIYPMPSKRNNNAGATAAASSKRITFTIPAATVARLKLLAKACDVHMSDVWHLIRKEAAGAVMDRDGLWMPAMNFAQQWDHGTRANYVRIAKRISMIDRDCHIELRFRGEEICYLNGKPAASLREFVMARNAELAAEREPMEAAAVPSTGTRESTDRRTCLGAAS